MEPSLDFVCEYVELLERAAYLFERRALVGDIQAEVLVDKFSERLKLLLEFHCGGTLH